MKIGGERRQGHIPPPEKRWMGKWGNTADPTTALLELSWMRPWDRTQHPSEDTKPQSTQKGCLPPSSLKKPQTSSRSGSFSQNPITFTKSRMCFLQKRHFWRWKFWGKTNPNISQKRQFLWFYFRRILSLLSFPLLASHPPYFTAQHQDWFVTWHNSSTIPLLLFFSYFYF